MGMNKLNDYEARCIGEAIAKKAMEHLITPLDNEIDYFVKTCHENLLADLGIAGREKEFIDAGVVQESSSITVKFVIDDDTSYSANLSCGSGRQLLDVTYSAWRVVDSRVVAAYVVLNDQRRPFIAKRIALAAELKQQMLGKSAKYIMKTWPEAAEFVASWFNIDIATGADKSMTAPLSELLAKYMPMLSAPHPQGV